MAKTLMYVPGSPTSVKLGDTDTDLYLQVAKDNVAVDLTAVKSITVKIADANNNYLKDISIAPASLTSGNNGILTVPLNSDNVGGLNSGDYYFEVWIVTADSETEIYPDMNVTKFHVFNNLVGGTSILTTLTMQAFLDRITSTQTASETSLNNSQTALANANTANTNAAKVLSDLNAGNYLTKDTLSNAPAFQALQTQVNNSAVGTNLIIRSELKNGCLNRDNGGVRDSGADFYSYNYIATNGETVFTFSSPDYVFNGNTDHALAMYDSKKNYLGYQTITSATQTLNNSNAAYIRFSINFTDEGGTSGKLTDWLDNHRCKLEKGSHATDWSANPAEILTQSDYAKIKAAIVALGGSLS